MKLSSRNTGKTAASHLTQLLLVMREKLGDDLDAPSPARIADLTEDLEDAIIRFLDKYEELETVNADLTIRNANHKLQMQSLTTSNKQLEKVLDAVSSPPWLEHLLVKTQAVFMDESGAMIDNGQSDEEAISIILNEAGLREGLTAAITEYNSNLIDGILRGDLTP